MKKRWLIPVGALLCLGMMAHGGGVPADASKRPVGFLMLQQDDGPCQAVGYEPRAGDLVLYDSHKKLHHFAYKLARTSAPIHAAMVIAREDGTPVLLELTGPYIITAKVCLLDVEPRFASYEGSIMVRRLREPMHPERSRELFCFAQAQVGKSFAAGRMALQASPFNPHLGLRRELFGHTYFNRQRWYCSELVVAAGTKAGLFDSRAMPANATYPRDLAYDERCDLSPLYHPPLGWVLDRAIVEGMPAISK